MFARMTISQVAPEKANEAESTMRDIVLPIMRQQKGFKNYCSFVDRATGKAVTVTIWETEADRQASDQPSDYYRDAIAKVAPFFVAPPVVEYYEAEIYS